MFSVVFFASKWIQLVQNNAMYSVFLLLCQIGYQLAKSQLFSRRAAQFWALIFSVFSAFISCLIDSFFHFLSHPCLFQMVTIRRDERKLDNWVQCVPVLLLGGGGGKSRKKSATRHNFHFVIYSALLLLT